MYEKLMKKALKVETYQYQQDMKYHILKSKHWEILNCSSGYSFSLPTKTFQYDYQYSKLRCKYFFEDCILTTSFEDKNPYGEKFRDNPQNAWDVYLDEWLIRYISHPDFLKSNHILETRKRLDCNEYLNGYQFIRYSFFIEDSEQISHPYYEIAIIRPLSDYIHFYLFVMKSKQKQNDLFDKICQSFQQIPQEGEACNEFISYPICKDKNWNELTRRYFEKLLEQKHVDWGIFEKSIVNKTDGSFDYISNFFDNYGLRLDKLTKHHFALFPTYMHISWYDYIHYFPMDMAKKYAGGDGFNHKKVLHFTFQYTANNNGSMFGYTPIYDILRGKYDAYFYRLAKDIKAYHYPVLFRLNNEMNTDWTSYAGILSMLDPDIFILTWKKLFDIFQEEKVDNCIWIFNPIAITAPYCNWGEYLNYYPHNMVHMLGLTAYERGNVREEYRSFSELYQALYEKNTPYFARFPQIISEFGAGAGGEVVPNYEKHGYDFLPKCRNLDKQTKWVEDMFQVLKERPEYVKNIKGAIWFSANDYAQINQKNYIMNYFQLDEEVMPTIQALERGLKNE